MERYEQIHRDWKQMMWDNFLGGISWGLGATVGAAIILALLTFVLKQVNFVPLIGNFAAQVSTYIPQKH